ncbi:hypothetical protein Glove_372g36 [Diversispora epigaea]|uniref:BACK domain-containing protein n=1 Tax=Diversispora epigaea TaxID=1348612 RepID=A0A397H6G2_9GLOM|nr:hypothetical protein Glove_372g36 [Diversispora epigaea]
MKESEIWDYLIKWGTAQNPTLPKKLEEWSDENFTTLKAILQRCLLLIRYFHISNSDVMDKIKPYKKILDEQLWDDLMQHFILPDRPVKSKILPPRIILTREQLARKNYTDSVQKELSKSTWIGNQLQSQSLTNNPCGFRFI